MGPISACMDRSGCDRSMGRPFGQLTRAATAGGRRGSAATDTRGDHRRRCADLHPPAATQRRPESPRSHPVGASALQSHAGLTAAARRTRARGLPGGTFDTSASGVGYFRPRRWLQVVVLYLQRGRKTRRRAYVSEHRTRKSRLGINSSILDRMCCCGLEVISDGLRDKLKGGHFYSFALGPIS